MKKRNINKQEKNIKEETRKTKVTQKRKTKTMREKQNNQPLSTGSFKPMDSFSLGKLSK